MSGKSNVIYWLEKRGIEPDENRVNRIYERAKAATGVLEESEIHEVVVSQIRVHPRKSVGSS